MDTELLTQRHLLVTTDTYKELRREAIDYIVSMSSGAMDDKLIRGMLLLIRYFDNWETDYLSALENRKDS